MPRQKWTPITKGDVMARLSAQELSHFEGQGRNPGDQATLQAIIDQVTEKVRGAVAACPRNDLGPVGTIPACVLYDAVSLVIMAVMTRVGGAALDGSGRRKEDADRARTLFDDKLPRCEGPAIPQPDDPDSSMTQQAVGPLYTKWHTEEWRRDQQDGV